MRLLREYDGLQLHGVGKSLLEIGEAENLPTARRRPIPPNQAFFVFRSPSQGNTWNEICDLTERLLKRFTKYGWCFSLPDRAHSSLQSAKVGVLRFQEQRALGGVLRQKELPITLILPGPNSSVGKESACSAGDLGSFPGLGRSPGECNGNPLQYPCLRNSLDRGVWWAKVHGGRKKSDKNQQLTTKTYIKVITYFVLYKQIFYGNFLSDY